MIPSLTCSKHPAGDGEHVCTRCLRPVNCAEYFSNDTVHAECAADQSFPNGSTHHHPSYRPIDDMEQPAC